MNALLSQPTGLPQPIGAEPALPKSPESPYFWMPLDASVTTRDVDWLYDVMVWISVISAVGIFAAMVYFVLKYRAKSRAANERVEETSDHNTTLEITWSFIPLVVVIALFVWGFKGYVDLRTPPKDALEIHVTAQKWSWLFQYPAELKDGVSISHNELHVPIDTPVRIIISSTDVLHSLFIPAFRVKMDAVPGRYTELWFNATKTGDFPIFCTEYCGTSHSDMLSRTVVHTPEDFQKWLDAQGGDESPAELGERLYNQRGCATCHSLDGSPKVGGGPTWKGVFGSTETMADGSTVSVDENYIKESIEEPQKRIVQGYPPSMPTFKGQLTDREITGLVEFIKAQK